jgi:GGDEF domain-containing protein
MRNTTSLHAPDSNDPIAALTHRDNVRAHLDSAIERARRHAAMLSVLCVDLADLRGGTGTADADGGPADHLTERVRRCARRSDLVAALDQNVCLIVAEFMEGPHSARRMADRIIGALQSMPTRGSKGALRGARIGFATASGAQLEGEHPLRRAHRAMMRARLESGHGRIVADASV